jgi:prepilin-type N-terminal cleavage/methylation domain-containing protein
MNKSFTLIEILVVIVIIGILSAFIIVSMAGISSKANIAKGQAFANSLRNSLLINLVSEYKLNGNVNDSWGANNGTIAGAPVAKSSADCVSGGCYQFNGTTDYITIGDASTFDNDIVNDFTVSVWANFAGLGATARDIFGKGYDYTASKGINFRKQTTDTITLLVGNGTTMANISSNSTIAANTWYMLVATYDGATAKIYVNGVLQTQTGAVSAPLQWHAATKMPAIGLNGGGVMYGKLDEVQIYSESVPVSKIRQDYYFGLNELLLNANIAFKEYEQKLGELRMNLAHND